jgi:diguanylate cyclase (GGDEF)-like protein/PAS domain S-box-containing protein
MGQDGKNGVKGRAKRIAGEPLFRGGRFSPSDDLYRVLFERNPIPMWVFNRKTLRFLAVNRAALRQYGYSETEFLGMTILEIRPEETVPALIEDVGLRRRGLQERAVWKHRRKDGSIIAVEIVCHDLEFDRTEAMLVAAYDVTERQRAQEAARVAEEKYRAIFDQAVVGIFQHTSDGRPLNVNRAFAKMHGYDSPEQLLAEVSDAAGQLFVEPERMAEIVRAALETGIVRGAEVELYRRDRSRFWVMVNLRAVKDSSGALRLFEGTAEDITDRKAAEAQVKFLAYHDALTGLPNRMLFMDRLENALAGARRKPAKAAVLFLDLDRFKYVNDSLGHSAGDEMLQEIAARLRQCLREEDTVARVGGDEFLIMLREVASREEVEAAAGRIREWVTRSFTIQSHSLSTSCSIGISLYPEDGADGETLIRKADAAMYAAKENGSNDVRFFSGEMGRRAEAQLTIESEMRSALARGEFFLEYQPVMEVASQEIAGAEALVRWQHPQLGCMAPEEFIPEAERSGLILPLGEWVLRRACAQAAAWQREGLKAVPVAVNVSALQFRQQEFSGLVRRVLAESGLAPEYLELELTESLLMSTGGAVNPCLRELNELGVGLAIDDFGTGYSSLGYLKRFRVSKLKVDRSFIRDAATDADDAAITKAIIGLAKSLHLRVVAEGVETEAQFRLLREWGCDQIQGYYLSRPVAAAEMARMLKDERLKYESAPAAQKQESVASA